MEFVIFSRNYSAFSADGLDREQTGKNLLPTDMVTEDFSWQLSRKRLIQNCTRTMIMQRSSDTRFLKD